MSLSVILKTKKLQLSMHATCMAEMNRKKLWLGNLWVHTYSQGQEKWGFHSE
jgi:hypothetical protein